MAIENPEAFDFPFVIVVDGDLEAPQDDYASDEAIGGLEGAANSWKQTVPRTPPDSAQA